MKLNKLMSSMSAVAVVGAASVIGTGCATEYKLVDRVQADGTVVRTVQEKTVLDKIDDAGTQHEGALRLLEVGGQYGFGIWQGTIGERGLKRDKSNARMISNAIQSITIQR